MADDCYFESSLIDLEGVLQVRMSQGFGDTCEQGTNSVCNLMWCLKVHRAVLLSLLLLPAPLRLISWPLRIGQHV